MSNKNKRVSMPSEKIKRLKVRSRPHCCYDDMKSQIKSFQRKQIENLLLGFSSYSTPLRKTVIVMTAISRYVKDGDLPTLGKALSFAIELEDHVTYDRAGEYCFVVYPIADFFKENSSSKDLMALLAELLPVLENSAMLLQDENSWYDAFEELSRLCFAE
ncbi:MAG: hypothetical protein KAG61_03925 [Bacteriovoracaceae bacterium]|nr:hypothetical protein [Bacteriovoracaceae bacterium]